MVDGDAPSQFGDDHFGTDPVELVPQFRILQVDLDVGIALHRRQRMLQKRIRPACMKVISSGAHHFCSTKTTNEQDFKNKSNNNNTTNNKKLKQDPNAAVSTGDGH